MRTIPEETKELARAMLKANKSYREVATALNLSVGSVHNIMAEGDGDMGPLVEEIKRRYAAKCYLLVDYILHSITDVDMGKASLKEKALAAAILTDKARLIEGKAGQEAFEHLNTPETPDGVEKERETGDFGAGI